MTENKQIQEMARILAEDCEQKSPRDCMNAECADCRAKAAYKAGYRKVERGEWKIVIGSNGKEKMVCTNCRHQQDLASTYTFCPNCGSKMKGEQNNDGE